jgi:hypothetical protein
MSRSAAGSPYRLDELGWLQFDRLSALLLEAEAGLEDLVWQGHSDGCRVAVADGVRLPEHAIRLDGVVTIAAVWVRDHERPDVQLSDFTLRAEAVIAESPGSPALIVTNIDRELAAIALEARALDATGPVVILGAGEIAASLDRDPGMRLAMPSVLGLRDLDPLIDATIRARSSFDLERAQELARVFWATRAYERSCAVLGEHRFVVLTGPPEMGKTAIAQMVALGLMTDGWEAHECTDPDQVWDRFDAERRQLFVADDAFGSTEYRPDAADRWARGLPRLLAALDSGHWLIWTSRPAPLKAGLRRVQAERGAERFPSPGQVLVDASELDLAEKTLILFRHAKHRGSGDRARAIVRSAAVAIVEHPHFTPERVRRFVDHRLGTLRAAGINDLTVAAGARRELLELIERELAVPTDAMRNSFRALGSEHRELLIALLDAPAGLIDERTLTATIRRHHAGGLSKPPTELIDRLTDHFLRITPLGIGWVHPSWRDLVIEELRADPPARLRFLAASGIDGVTLALSRAGGSRGHTTLPLLMTDADWDALGDRTHQLLHDLEDHKLSRLLVTLADAPYATTDDLQAHEARCLATQILTLTSRAWDSRHRPVSVFLIDAWYTLEKIGDEHPNPPRLELTWAELHPGSYVAEDPDHDELARADEWLALAQTLARHDPAALAALGFYDNDRSIIERLIVALARRSTDQELRPLSQSVLARIQAIMPDLADTAHSASVVGRLADDLNEQKWWAPHDIDAPPTTEPASTTNTEFRPIDVSRVLRDL